MFARGVLEGEDVGVVARIVELEGDRAVDGDSGRLKGDARGEPKPSGEGFFGDVVDDWWVELVGADAVVNIELLTMMIIWLLIYLCSLAVRVYCFWMLLWNTNSSCVAIDDVCLQCTSHQYCISVGTSVPRARVTRDSSP